ncbi:MAG: short-chain dehydrogenase [Armatimonadota bacterium]|nr:short-chain dehydrogenase [Armatimonadota bacterium]MDR5696934.1 short-chain dehydrogenase [Armatimonadota bacterium]
MEITGRRVLVLGGAGLVGRAVCRALLEQAPSALVVASVDEASAREAVAQLREEFPSAPTALEPDWGNVFVRWEFKDWSWDRILDDDRARELLLHDLFEEMTGPRKQQILQASTLVRMLARHRPDIVVDCINTATAFAYRDIYQSARELRQLEHSGSAEALRRGLEQHLCKLDIPHLVRHIQILHEASKPDPAGGYGGVRAYVKVGTSGTGGMGLNIPYTHGEERPSRKLLSKSAVAGAHTLLLFLMARTPGAPMVKEIKPTAAIAWKAIGYGPIRRAGQPIPLVDCPPDRAVPVADAVADRGEFGVAVGGVLESVFIDTGENGLFSAGEFETLTALRQMEYVTPEEIAAAVVEEIRGGNTGLDVIAALDASTMGPTYRAGVLRQRAIDRLRALEREHGTDSVAFELLGPPRVSKLLYEAYLLRRCCETIDSILAAGPEALSARLWQHVREDADMRRRILSIGLAVLLPDGDRMLRGPQLKAQTADDGWIDLTPRHMARWQRWLGTIRDEAARESAADASGSSWFDRRFVDPRTWQPRDTFEIGEVVAWILIHEDQGPRLKR